MSINREYRVEYSVACTNSATTSETVDFRNFSAASVSVPTGSDITSIAVYGCSTEDGTFLPLYDQDGIAVAIAAITAGRIYELPSAAFSLPWLKLYTNAAGTVHVMMKA